MPPKGIYVERSIAAGMDRLWQFTQDPALHQRWDMRFTSIEYLPRPNADEPQRFLYTTRIGLGLKISGEGESIGEIFKADGSRTSKLAFWSGDPKALIRRGTGYWRYVPAGGAIRFITYYDYTTRFGVAGRLADRIFRPLLGWATARSFDALALWLEQGIEPERAGMRPRASRCLRTPATS